MSDQKVDKILEKITDIEKTLVRHEGYHERNTASLETHILRTNLLEKRIELLVEEVDPIKTHVAVVGSVIKSGLIGLGILGSVLMGLHSMGILQKLF